MPVRHMFAAAARHDPAGLPLNRGVKFTENPARFKVGSEGLWVAASDAPTGPRSMSSMSAPARSATAA